MKRWTGGQRRTAIAKKKNVANIQKEFFDKHRKNKSIFLSSEIPLHSQLRRQFLKSKGTITGSQVDRLHISLDILSLVGSTKQMVKDKEEWSKNKGSIGELVNISSYEDETVDNEDTASIVSSFSKGDHEEDSLNQIILEECDLNDSMYNLKIEFLSVDFLLSFIK